MVIDDNGAIDDNGTLPPDVPAVVESIEDIGYFR